MEIWKPIKEFDGLYCVSNMGNVKKIAYTKANKNGKNIEYAERQILPHPEYRTRVNNINGDLTDNRVENLQWKKGFPDAYYAKTRKAVICENMTFESIKKCADYYGVFANNMSQWLNGKLPMPKRFIVMNLRYAK